MIIEGPQKICDKKCSDKTHKNTFTTKDKVLVLHERDEVNRFFFLNRFEKRFFRSWIGLDKKLWAMGCLGVSPMCTPPLGPVGRPANCRLPVASADGRLVMAMWSCACGGCTIRLVENPEFS